MQHIYEDRRKRVALLSTTLEDISAIGNGPIFRPEGLDVQARDALIERDTLPNAMMSISTLPNEVLALKACGKKTLRGIL